MQEKLQNMMNAIVHDRKKRFIAGSITFVTLGLLIAVAILGGDSEALAKEKLSSDESTAIKIITVGSSTEGFVSVGNSWPAEIISLSSMQVQPAREGTITEWYVHVGQSVSQGQILGKLSQPPAMPDLISMVAGEEESLSKMKTQATAERKFTEERIVQLKQLKQKIESTQVDRAALLGGGAAGTNLSIVEVKKKAARAVLQSSITKTVPMLTGVSVASARSANTTLRYAIGAQNFSLRSGFTSTLFKVMDDLADPIKLPEQSGLAYFDLTIKLVNASIADGSEITSSDLDSLKDMLIEQQADFIGMLNEVKTMELDVTEKDKESFEQLRDIEAQISELQKSLSIAEGEVDAAQKSFRTISGTVYGGYSIIAPRAGVISSIMKKPGEIVEPGMSVATITGKGDEKKIVRIRVPNNIPKPLVGEDISVTRPGFAHNVHQAKIIGIGLSLDDTGSYMADAILTSETDWPTGASVRVIPPDDSSTSAVKLSSVWWGANGTSMLWKVSSAGRVYSEKVTLGRTLGTMVEVLEGLKNGDRYIESPTEEIAEDMLVSDIQDPEQEKVEGSSSDKSDGMENMPGM